MTRITPEVIALECTNYRMWWVFTGTGTAPECGGGRTYKYCVADPLLRITAKLKEAICIFPSRPSVLLYKHGKDCL